MAHSQDPEKATYVSEAQLRAVPCTRVCISLGPPAEGGPKDAGVLSVGHTEAACGHGKADQVAVPESAFEAVSGRLFSYGCQAGVNLRLDVIC